MKMFGLFSFLTLSIFFNNCFVQSFSLPYVDFVDALSDQAFLHHYGRVHKKHKRSRISKILKFQMDKILRLHNRHMDQGNMSRSHREEFERKLKIKFDRIKNYSKKRLRNDYKEKRRFRRFQNRKNQWFKNFLKHWIFIYHHLTMKNIFICTSKFKFLLRMKQCNRILYWRL